MDARILRRIDDDRIGGGVCRVGHRVPPSGTGGCVSFVTRGHQWPGTAGSRTAWRVKPHRGRTVSRTCDSPERSELAQCPARPTIARPDTAQPRTTPRDTPALCVTRRAWGARSGLVVRRAVPGTCRTRVRGVPIADGGRRCGRGPASGLVLGTSNRRPGRARARSSVP